MRTTRPGLAGLVTAVAAVLLPKPCPANPRTKTIYGANIFSGTVSVISGHRGGVCRPHLTHAELEDRANRLALYLRRAGVGTKTIAPVPGPLSGSDRCEPRGMEGGRRVPLEPGDPPGRLAFMLTVSRATVLAGTTAILDQLPAGQSRPSRRMNTMLVAASM
jgi:hypothetical protein